MKLSEVYSALQERYPVEQEKKLAAEERRREELKHEITRIIDTSRRAIENSAEDLYCAYEKARKEQEDYINRYPDCVELNEKKAGISVVFSEIYIKLWLHVNETTHNYTSKAFINQFPSKSNSFAKTELSTILMSYCVDHCKIQLDSTVHFYLISNEVCVTFSLQSGHNGAWTEEECLYMNKFISDIKEMFPNSKESSELKEGHVGHVDISVVLDSPELDIYNSKQSVNTEEAELLKLSIDKLNLSIRTLSALKQYGRVFTVKELVQLSEYELKKINHIGPKSFSEIMHRLKEFGLTMKS